MNALCPVLLSARLCTLSTSIEVHSFVSVDVYSCPYPGVDRTCPDARCHNVNDGTIHSFHSSPNTITQLPLSLKPTTSASSGYSRVHHELSHIEVFIYPFLYFGIVRYRVAFETGPDPRSWVLLALFFLYVHVLELKISAQTYPPRRVCRRETKTHVKPVERFIPARMVDTVTISICGYGFGGRTY